MTVIWVLENIKKNYNSNDYYIDSKFNVLLLLASVHLWKKHNRDDKCVLYADDLTIDFLNKHRLLEYWDSIKTLPKPRRINKDIFWAATKVEVLAELNEPAIIMDNDTHFYKPVKHLLDLDKVYVCNLEEGKGYYPTFIDEYVSKLSIKERWKPSSVNVSFLNLPDPDFTKEYAEMSLKMMEEFTSLKAPNSQYLIFSEQLLLRHLLDKKNIEYNSLISNYWNCKDWDWGSEHDKGIWTAEESEVYFKHYGPLKGWYLNNKKGFSYVNHIKHLENCINLPNLDLSSLPRR